MSILAALFGLLLFVLGLISAAVLVSLALVLKAAISQEAAAVVPAAVRSLLDRTKERLPAEARSRWEEEWPAGFDQVVDKRPIWALWQALSLYVGASRIARGLEPVPAVVGTSWLARVGSAVREADRGFGAALERAYGFTLGRQVGIWMRRLRFVNYPIAMFVLLIIVATSVSTAERLIG